jgi:hypothetical protein
VLRTFYDNSAKGITVPYPPLFGGVRRNHGFVDLRGRPDLVAQVPETSESLALRDLLVDLAQPASPIFSLGCDLGTHNERGRGKLTRYVAGGYIQVMKNAYSTTSGHDYLNLAQTLGSIVDGGSEEHDWVLRYECASVAFKLDQFSETIPSLWTWFFAGARTLAAAAKSREHLIVAFGSALVRSTS